MNLPIDAIELLKAAEKRFPDKNIYFTIKLIDHGTCILYEVVIDSVKGWRVGHFISTTELRQARSLEAIAAYATRTMLHQIETAKFIEPGEIFPKKEPQ